jgi:hypothetical protein
MFINPISASMSAANYALNAPEAHPVQSAGPPNLPALPFGSMMAPNRLAFSQPSVHVIDPHLGSQDSTGDFALMGQGRFQGGAVAGRTSQSSSVASSTQSVITALEKTAAPISESPLKSLLPSAAEHARITLDFKSSTWQNRPSRIYFDAEEGGLDWSLLMGLDAIPRHLVLSENQATGPVYRLPNGPDSPDLPIYNYKRTFRPLPGGFAICRERGGQSCVRNRTRASEFSRLLC